MKLAALLTEYFLSNKRLDLPGIGIFRIIETITEEKDIAIQASIATSEEIIFENDPSIKDVPELINFLASRSGKMKSLTAADLNSHLRQAKEFLNIGKPFLFEGIGSLSKLNSGEYVFVSWNPKDLTSKEINITSGTEDSLTNYKNIFSASRAKILWKKPVLILFVLAGLAVAAWLGYIVYRNSIKNKPVASQEIKVKIIPDTDTRDLNKDSTKTIPAKPQNGEYKYILEVANKYRAFERFGRLKSYGWKIQMETADSVEYKLFLSLRVPPENITSVIDSLSLLNGRKVYIEN